MSTFRSGRGVRGTERVKTDVVVVGSGAGGAAAAYELANAGVEVMVLEAGPQVRPEEFTQREMDTIKRLYVDQGTQGPADGSVAILQGRMLGGSTVINGEVCFRIPEFILESWATEHGVRGLSAGEMKDAFATVERMIHATPNEGRYLGSGKRFAAGFSKLGIEDKPVVRSVKDCQNCSYCFFGLRLRLQAVHRPELPARRDGEGGGRRQRRPGRDDPARRVGRATRRRRAHGRGHAGGRARGRVVLACGAIETPLMLLDHGLGGSEVGTSPRASSGASASSAGTTTSRSEYRSAMRLAVLRPRSFGDGFVIELFGANPAFAAPSVPGFGFAHKRGGARSAPCERGRGRRPRRRRGAPAGWVVESRDRGASVARTWRARRRARLARRCPDSFCSSLGR